jgi:hypothetical protein
MESPGALDLCDFEITTNVDVTSTPVEDLDGMLALTVELAFAYSSGGSSAKAYVQTSIDQGKSWIDIACVTFAAASKTVVLNFSALTPKLVAVLPTNGTLADDTAIDGILGERLRVRLKTTGAAYAAATTLTGRAVAR